MEKSTIAADKKKRTENLTAVEKSFLIQRISKSCSVINDKSND